MMDIMNWGNEVVLDACYVVSGDNGTIWAANKDTFLYLWNKFPAIDELEQNFCGGRNKEVLFFVQKICVV